MNILGIDPQDYRKRWDEAMLAAKAADLGPVERAMLWRETSKGDDWYEMPVPVEYFLSDPYYFGSGLNLRPAIGEVLGKFWTIDARYELWVFIAGIGTGKSFSGALSIAYALYLLSCVKRPARYFSRFPGVSLSEDSEIVVLNASAAGAEQASKVVFGDVVERIINSPYFADHYAPNDRVRSELLFPNRIRFSPGTSRWQSALGWNVFGFIVDEAAFGVESQRADYVGELFKALNQRRRSRFGSLGFGALLTSPSHDQAFVESLARQGTTWDNTMLVTRMSTWDAKGELQPGEKVFLFDRHPNRMRILKTDLTYKEPGVVVDSEGNEIRYKSEINDPLPMMEAGGAG